jgi:hypothetical protein
LRVLRYGLSLFEEDEEIEFSSQKTGEISQESEKYFGLLSHCITAGILNSVSWMLKKNDFKEELDI